MVARRAKAHEPEGEEPAGDSGGDGGDGDQVVLSRTELRDVVREVLSDVLPGGNGDKGGGGTAAPPAKPVADESPRALEARSAEVMAKAMDVLLDERRSERDAARESTRPPASEVAPKTPGQRVREFIWGES